MTSPLTKGLYRGAIAVNFPYDFLTKQHSIGNVWQKEKQGLKFAAAKKVASIAELRKMPAEALFADDPAVEPFTKAALGGGMNTDGWSFLVDYPKALDQGMTADVPILTGITADDFGPPAEMMKTTVATFPTAVASMFGEKKAAFSGLADSYLALCPVKMDQESRTAAKRAQQEYRMASIFSWAQKRAKSAKSPVYTYFFDQAIPWPEHPEFGAFHSSDLVYAFNNLAKLNRPWTDVDRRVADELSTCWVNFVKFGNPNGSGAQAWRAFHPDKPETMTLGAKPGMRDIADPERWKFYEQLHRQ